MDGDKWLEWLISNSRLLIKSDCWILYLSPEYLASDDYKRFLKDWEKEHNPPPVSEQVKPKPDPEPLKGKVMWEIKIGG
jgi:hypothetical protein